MSFNLQSAIFGLRLQSAVCSLRSAVCSLQSAVYGLQSAVCGLQSANVIHRKWIQQSLAAYKLAKTSNLFTVQFQELLRIVRIFWETYRFNSQEFFTFTCIHRLSTRNRTPPPLVFHRPFSTVECSLGYKQYLLFSFRAWLWVCWEATIGSLSNDDADGNENGKKSSRFD